MKKKKAIRQARAAKSSKERAVIVCTEYRGVFFGYAKDTSGDVITLMRARNCVYWHQSIGGVLGLAERGPNAQCRIGARANIELRKVTSVIECEPVAVASWEAATCLA